MTLIILKNLLYNIYNAYNNFIFYYLKYYIIYKYIFNIFNYYKIIIPELIMSVFHSNNSSKNILRNNITPIKSIQNKRGNSVENNLKKSQNKSLYKKNDYNKNLLILNYIMKKSGKKNSLRTTCSDSVFESDNKKYDLSMINKHEEDLNSSLSFISEFDLEKDDYKELNDSFSSENKKK